MWTVRCSEVKDENWSNLNCTMKEIWWVWQRKDKEDKATLPVCTRQGFCKEQQVPLCCCPNTMHSQIETGSCPSPLCHTTKIQHQFYRRSKTQCTPHSERYKTKHGHRKWTADCIRCTLIDQDRMHWLISRDESTNWLTTSLYSGETEALHAIIWTVDVKHGTL